MPFGLVDDKLHAHVKWRRASKGARALWTTALSWCSSFPSGGHVPADMLKALDGTHAEAERLVQVGLWEEQGDGWVFHQWDERNPDAESAKAALAAKSEGGKVGNHKRWHADRGVRVKDCPLCYPNGSDNRSDTESDTESDSDRFGNRFGHRTESLPSPSPFPSPDTSIEVSTETTKADPFDAFWAAYPRRDDRGHAVKAFRTALRKTSAEELTAAAASFAQGVKRERRERKFIPLASTWLNGERWADEPQVVADPEPVQRQPQDGPRSVWDMVTDVTAQRLEQEARP